MSIMPEIDKNGGISKTITSYINFANSKHPNRPVTEMLVSGSRQDINAIALELTTQNITAINAVSRLASTNVINHTLLHTSHGLSLKTFDLQPSLNLLPIDFRLAIVKNRLMHFWLVMMDMLIVFSLVGILALYYIDVQAVINKAELSALANQYQQQLHLPQSQALITQADRLNQITGQLMTLREVTGGEENILSELSTVTPDGITLTSFVISRNPGIKRLYEPGNSWVITGSANSRSLVLNFYNNLLSNTTFSDGKLYFGSLEKETGITFRIANVPTK
ncbi:hypothetical protein GW844_03800 [bacterium]|nr:hypothetical protein [bacterium]